MAADADLQKGRQHSHDSPASLERFRGFSAERELRDISHPFCGVVRRCAKHQRAPGEGPYFEEPKDTWTSRAAACPGPSPTAVLRHDRTSVRSAASAPRRLRNLSCDG